MSYMELGGFAENPGVLDGTKETFNAFNFCLAELYLDAIYSEDFDALGRTDDSLIEKVAYWLNYDGKIGQRIAEDIEKMKKGELITCNNRSFIKAIIENKHVYSARTWLQLGSKDMDLLIFYILNNEDDYISINQFTIGSLGTKEEIIKTLSNIFKYLKNKYDSISNEQEKLEFLKKVRLYLENIKWDISIGQISIKMIDADNFIESCILKK